MATIRRLPCFELLFLFVGVWLCLALEPNAAARLPSDRFVFPSESQPNLESRLQKIGREIEEVSRLTNVSVLMMPQEAKKGMPKVTSTITSTGSEKPPETTTGTGKEGIGKPVEQEGNLSSESKVITFSSDLESNSQRPWDQTEVPPTVKIKVVLEPRITLETSPICQEGFILTSNDRCRKIANK